MSPPALRTVTSFAADAGTIDIRHDVSGEVLVDLELRIGHAFDRHGWYIIASMLRRTSFGRRWRASFMSYALVATFVAIASEICLISFKGG